MITRASGLKTLARSVGRQKLWSIARQIVFDDRIRHRILHYLGKHIQKEMKYMCSDKAGKVTNIICINSMCV